MTKTGIGRNIKKGGNPSYELYELKALNRIFAAVVGGGGIPSPTGLATETTASAILAAVSAIGPSQDIEILLVRDTGNGDKVVQQIVDYTTGSPVISYLDVNGASYSPIGVLEYLDTSAVMNLILTELVGINIDQATVAMQGAMQAELVNMLGKLTDLEAKNYATEVTLALLDTHFTAENFAQEDTLADVKTAVEALTDVVWEAGKAIPTAVGTFAVPTLLGINPDATGTIKVILFNDGTTETDLEVWEILNTTIIIKEFISVTGTLADVKLYQK